MAGLGGVADGEGREVAVGEDPHGVAGERREPGRPAQAVARDGGVVVVARQHGTRQLVAAGDVVVDRVPEQRRQIGPLGRELIALAPDIPGARA